VHNTTDTQVGVTNKSGHLRAQNATQADAHAYVSAASRSLSTHPLSLPLSPLSLSQTLSHTLSGRGRGRGGTARAVSLGRRLAKLRALHLEYHPEARRRDGLD
jgi:hypothetical protein